MKGFLENIDDKQIDLVCIYSLPRSGSTALIAELDRIEGIVCLPEYSGGFPDNSLNF
jgi:hypothetical protein